MAILYSYLISTAISSLSAALDINSQMFYIKTFVFVTDYEEKFKTSTALVCAEECRRRPTCDSFAYINSAGECYVQAMTMQQAERGVNSSDVRAYVTLCE